MKWADEYVVVEKCHSVSFCHSHSTYFFLFKLKEYECATTLRQETEITRGTKWELQW